MYVCTLYALAFVKQTHSFVDYRYETEHKKRHFTLKFFYISRILTCMYVSFGNVNKTRIILLFIIFLVKI